MRRFLYFFLNLPGVNAKMLADRGVLDRFAAHGGTMLEYGVTGIASGPGGGSGCLVAVGGPAEFDANRQRWVEGAKFWVGIEDAQFPPRPEDLIRPVGISGQDLILGDGNAWRVPLIRKWDRVRLEHVSNLPKRLISTFDASGSRKMVSKVQADFEDVDALAEWVFDAFIEGKNISIEELFERSIRFLSVNYRIGIEEAGLLGLLDVEVALKVLRTAADLLAIQAQAEELETHGLKTEPLIEEE